MSTTVHTVLGPVPADQLGIVAAHEALLSITPGAEYAFDIEIDRAEIFQTLAGTLRAFKEAGGGTVVDAIGMFHGRDLRLYETLSRTTGVHIVASTGLGPEEMLGGYFLTPQTNPPTPWPAEKFADLFTREVTEGMVIPRFERRAAAGLVVTTAARTGITATERSLFTGAARTAAATGIPVSLRWGADPVAELEVALAEGLPADRVVVADLDRADAAGTRAPFEIAARGAFVGFTGVGRNDDPAWIVDRDRVGLIAALIDAGHTDRLLLSAGTTGAAFGHPATELPLSYVHTTFAGQLRAAGIPDAALTQIIERTPRELLTVRAAQAEGGR